MLLSAEALWMQLYFTCGGSRTLRVQMEELRNWSALQAAGVRTSPVISQQSHVRLRRQVAAVNSPALSAARLTLPGVMDAEGRVDESRLRLHIFKNGTAILLSVKITIFEVFMTSMERQSHAVVTLFTAFQVILIQLLEIVTNKA